MNRIVVFFCVNDAGQVLLAQRAKDGKFGFPATGTWSCGSGTVEDGETFEAACVREVGEEFGADASDYVFLRSRSGSFGGRSWVAADYLVRLHGPVKNQAPEEHSRLAWGDVRRPDTWSKPWHPAFADFLRANLGTIFKLIPQRPAPMLVGQ